MSNIDRRYSYHDDGVLPSEGEYGVTYLTLYSSGAGNVYDGWMWDPDRVHYSETERTFGYRNPDYPDYCWDDEVVVDLSNAQTRQESSEFEQGRITSFNTNVSDQPILLQDIDITGLNEEEREAKATTVLFSAIPLVKDAYIHAEVEIQAKMNISPDNTTGTVRMEAFYIINNESDRTMRPNPVDHRAVCTTDERNTFRFLYWNPALSHEDHNYIGVKLLCTGGTAEIGISDNPEYGDAIITLTSAGLTGDHIDGGHPVSLDIYGKSSVPPNYVLKESDYTVLCTYDTGEVYDVTRLCTYSPEMGSQIVEPETTLTAYYQGLTASMTLYLALVESIELISTAAFQTEYTFDISDYTVLAHYETGDVMDITTDEELIFDPPMGTTITQDTTLTATYAPTYMPGSEFEDTYDVLQYAYREGFADADGYGLIYTYFSDGRLVISGKVPPFELEDDASFTYVPILYKYEDEATWPQPISYDPSNWHISRQMEFERLVRQYWQRQGTSYQQCSRGMTYYHQTLKYNRKRYSWEERQYFEGDIYNIENSNPTIWEYYAPSPQIVAASYSKINECDIDTIEWKATGAPLGLSLFERNNSSLTISHKIRFVGFDRMDTSKIVTLRGCFRYAEDHVDLSFLNSMSFPKLVDIREAFLKCDVSDLTTLNAPNIKILDCAFYWNTGNIRSDLSIPTSNAISMCSICYASENVEYAPFRNWDLSSLEHLDFAFGGSLIPNDFTLGQLVTLNLETADGMFAGCIFSSGNTNFISQWNRMGDNPVSLRGMFAGNKDVSSFTYGGWPSRTPATSYALLTGFQSFLSTIPHGCDLSFFFAGYSGSNVSDLVGASTWNHKIDGIFAYSKIASTDGLNAIGTRCKSAALAFYYCVYLTGDIDDIGNWDMGGCEDIRSMFGNDYSGSAQPLATNYARAVSRWNTQSLKACSFAFYKAGTYGTVDYEYGGFTWQIPAIYLLNTWNHGSLLNDYHMTHYKPTYGSGRNVAGGAPAYYSDSRYDSETGTWVDLRLNLMEWYNNTF